MGTALEGRGGGGGGRWSQRVVGRRSYTSNREREVPKVCSIFYLERFVLTSRLI